VPPIGRDTLSSLDHRAPLVLDIHELGRRPGSSRSVSRSVPAPTDLGTDVVTVPSGSQVLLELRLEAVMEGALVSGTARAQAVGECVRCLRDLDLDLEVDLQELYVYPESEAADDEAGRVLDDAIDLEPLLRDAVVLALPFRPLCREECPGLCPVCGVRLDHDPGHVHDEGTDPRWAALEALLTEEQRAEHDDTRAGAGPGQDEE